MKDDSTAGDGHRSIASLKREIYIYKYEIRLINAGIQQKGSVKLIKERIKTLRDQIKAIRTFNKKSDNNS